MPKHTIYSTNNRLRCRNFQSYNFWEYLTDWRNTGLLQTKEDKNRRTMAGCGVWRTAQKEIAAAMLGTCGPAKRPLSNDF